MNTRVFFLITCLIGILSFKIIKVPNEKRILVFSKTTGFRHKSIAAGVGMFHKIGKKWNIKVDATESPEFFNDQTLSKYSAIVFLSTTGEILNHAQQNSLQKYIQSGGGFMGIHGASGAEYNWPWYGKLIGARFESHPTSIQKGSIYFVDKEQIATEGLPSTWEVEEEWYNFFELSSDIHILGNVNEGSYQGGKHGDNHPVIWCQEFDGGRSFYTALGHRSEIFNDPVFIKHIENGLKYVARISRTSENKSIDNVDQDTISINKNVLAGNEHVQEPMELAVSQSGQVFFCERRGNLRLYNPITKRTKVIGTVPVYTEYEDGLLGLALDPDFETNNWIYVFYSAPGAETNYHLSRLTFDRKKEHVSIDSEKLMLKIRKEHTYSNHTGGSMAFDKNGNLFVSVGDNTIPFDSRGYAPIDERGDRIGYDAQRSSGNTNDLRGKILRIHPEPDGTYSIPRGNLFDRTDKGLPEIYVMGNRNPFRISVDQKTSWLYWGEVGPDASKDGPEGPKGYDEVNQAREAGNFGWPYFVADNKPYARVNFTTGAFGPLFNPLNPVNQSPRNTGSKNLPMAIKPLIWYPYATTSDFPLLGAGGRTAMVGPVYHYDKNLKSKVKLPQGYDKGLFIYDWIRKWIMVVKLDESGNYKSMVPFMKSMSFASIIDMEIGPDGALYILEYGSTWYQPNPNAKLSRLEYAHTKIESPTDKNALNELKKGDSKPLGSVTEASPGLTLISKSDCKACHEIDQISVGPSFKAIAKQYKYDPATVKKLAEKIISGGGGIWGPHVMSAHPQFSKEEAKEMVEYIFQFK